MATIVILCPMCEKSKCEVDDLDIENVSRISYAIPFISIKLAFHQREIFVCKKCAKIFRERIAKTETDFLIDIKKENAK